MTDPGVWLLVYLGFTCFDPALVVVGLVLGVRLWRRRGKG